MTDLKKEDFYHYVNGDWLKTAVIPADKPATGGFQDLVDDIDQLLINDLNQMAASEKKFPLVGCKTRLLFISWPKITTPAMR